MKAWHSSNYWRAALFFIVAAVGCDIRNAIQEQTQAIRVAAAVCGAQ